MENQKKLRILMLEDNHDDVFLIERVLRKENVSFVSECVDGQEEFTKSIREFKPDVVLSDHGLPGFNSMEALKICLKENPFSPFILVTGTVSYDFAISCIRQGADDYILKSNLSRLPSAIIGALKRRKVERLKREARHALRQQNEKLVKVNKELDSFVYSVSHNLRGPLATVIGLVDIAKSESNVEAIHAVHALMTQSLAKLDGTLREILDFARNARNEIYLSEIDWPVLITNCFVRLEHLDKDVDKHIFIQNDTGFYSDMSRLTVIMTSLLSNAMFFRHALRPVRIDVKISASESFCTVMVKDNGVGIPASILPKVFDMFYRGNEKSQGAGLGLYIARETVNKLEGNITIQSQPDEGTTVMLMLPNKKYSELPAKPNPDDFPPDNGNSYSRAPNAASPC